MKTLPYVSIYIPWLAMIGCEIALFVLLWKDKEPNKYRGFEAYITATVAVSLALLMISFTRNDRVYFCAFYIGALVKTIALAAAVLEQYKIQFFPRWSMSNGIFKILTGALVSVILASVGFAAFTPQLTPLWELAWARRVVSLSDYLLCGSMGLLLIYGELLNVRRPQRAQAIVRGMIATGVLGVTASLMLSVAGTMRLGGIVGFSTTIGFVAVLISWIVAFRKPDVVSDVDSSTEEANEFGRNPMPMPAVAREMLIYKV